MEPVKSTTPSSASSVIRDAPRPSLDLNLPTGEGFDPLPPLVSLATMTARSRQLRQWFPHSVRTEEERWQAKAIAPFVI